GVFPWFNEGDPILWWSPHPRTIIELADGATPTSTPGYGGLHVAHRLARSIRSGKFRVTVHQCFETVVRSCGENRVGRTWVTSDMLSAYTQMHRLGHAHCVETWVPRTQQDSSAGECKRAGETDEELAGGVYGIAIGGLFAAESMFYRVSDGSKVALAALVAR